MRVYSLTGKTGCLLPTLIFLNLFFGWMIFKPIGIWLLAGVILCLLFILQLKSSLNKFTSGAKPKGKAIDVEAEVLDDQE